MKPTEAIHIEERETRNSQKFDQDEARLARFGKRQQFQRNFGLLSVVALTSTLMITWEAIDATFQQGWVNGGAGTLLYGFIFVWLGNILQTAVMAEIASMIQLSGGQYNWVAVLAPRSCRRFLSYLTGWMTIFFWQTNTASVAFVGGTTIQGLLILNYPSYDVQPWHGVLLFYAVVAVALFVNTYLARQLPRIEALILFIHVFGFFAVLIPWVYFAPRASVGDVFASFKFTGGWPSNGLSFFIGISPSMYSFIGVDAASHIGEEIENSSLTIPRSMWLSTILNGALGLAMIIALLFCMGDPEIALTGPSGYPYIDIWAYMVGSTSGGTSMAVIITAMFSFGCIGILATASRMTWAFARENGLPGSRYISKIEPRTSLPLWSILQSTVSALLLALISLGSQVALQDLFSLVIVGFYSTFILSASVMLHKRLTTPASKIDWGKYRLGRAGVPVTVLALLYSIVGLFFVFWPATPGPDPTEMNWTAVVFGGALLISIGFWFAHGRRVYKGPIMEI